MALTAAQQMFAYYVIASVESDCDYGCVYQADAITLGMAQFYGQHAYRLLRAVAEGAPDAYSRLTTRLQQLGNGGEQTWEYWTNVYLENDDANSWRNSATLESNQRVQDEFTLNYLFGDDGEGGIYGTLKSWGLGNSAKTAIYYMVMYHQRPVAASSCMGSLGGNASLENLRDWCLSDRVLGGYANRYNEAYQLLIDWDGTSEPPDFGTTGTVLPNDPSGQIAAGTLQSTLAYVQSWGNDLMAIGEMSSTDRLLLHNTGKGIWLPVDGTVPHNPALGSPVSGSMPPASQDDPADFPPMRELWQQYENAFSYSQGPGRLNLPESGYSDCSGTIYWAANATTNGKYSWMGASTRTMLQNCHLVQHQTSGFTIDVEMLRPGDLLIMGYQGSSTTSHVEWYMGGTTVWGAGSAPLPHHTSDDVANFVKTWSIPVANLWICRFLD